MNHNRFPSIPLCIGLCLALALSPNNPVLATDAAKDANVPPPRKHTTMERMKLERLLAVQQDVRRLKSKLEPTPAAVWQLPGGVRVTDYKAILHAHAEDASHTGGTRPEMLADAKRAGVQAILLSDHYRPPRDFIRDTWRGLHDGVLFIPGSECRGFLAHPVDSVMDQMQVTDEQFIKVVTEGEGLIFLSHVERRPDYPMQHLTGMEIYNRHYDAIDSVDDKFSLVAIAMQMTDPEGLAKLEEAVEKCPDEILASQLDYPMTYLRKWDADSQLKRIVGIAANDCHHNQVYVVKVVDAETVRIGTVVDKDEDMRLVKATLRPGIRKLTKGKQPGEVVGRLDLDPYFRSFNNVCTHIFATELTEAAIRRSLAEGHCYVSHDWMADPSGFVFTASTETSQDQGNDAPVMGLMGDEVDWNESLKLTAEFPLACHVRLIKDGRLFHEESESRSGTYQPDGPGVYRIEAWLTLDDELRPWIYSNPIYVRP